MTDQKNILILGIGNLLLKDEGVGVHVVERLKAMPLPENVEVLDGAAGGLDLLYYIGSRKKLIVIDAVNAGERPGTLYRLTEENLEAKPKTFFSSLHEIDFLDALDMAGTMGIKPGETVVIGIEPGDISEGIGLSPEIEECIPEIIKLVIKELNGKEIVEQGAIHNK